MSVIHIGSGTVLATVAALEAGAIASDVLIPGADTNSLDIIINSDEDGVAQRQVYTGAEQDPPFEFRYANNAAALADDDWEDEGATIVVVAGVEKTVSVTSDVRKPQRLVYTPDVGATNHTTTIEVSSSQSSAAVGGGTSSTFIALADSDSTVEDAVVTGNVLTNDTTEDGTLAVMSFTVPSIEPGEPADVYQAGATADIPGRGTFTINSAGAWTFTPLADYSGSVPVITVQITNGSELRVSSLTLAVTAANDGPIARADYVLSFNGEPVTLNVLTNDVDPDGDGLTLTLVNGLVPVVDEVILIDDAELVYQGDGQFLVTPDALFEGIITFNYTISDGSLTDTATVTVQVGVDNLPLFSPFSPIVSGNPLDQAAVDFGLTYMARVGNAWGNGVNVASPPYSSGQGLFSLTDREPWLYDRATTVWLLAKRTGDASILAYALTLAQTYMAGVTVTNGLGQFTIFGNTSGEGTDIKYLYPIVAWWYEYETGDTVYRARAQAMYRQALNFTTTYVVSAELWTERNAGYAILACLAWHWISGDAAALNDATEYVDGIIAMSTSGAPLHGHDQHEGDGNTTPITSPWMGAFLAESMLQYYRTLEDPRILTWLSAYGDFIHDHCCYVATGADEPELAGLAGLRMAAYLAGTAVQYPEGEAADMRHCMDVAELLRKCSWAKGVLLEDSTDIDLLITEMEEAALVDIAYWTRFTEGYPKFRVNPSRSYGWHQRNRYSAVYFAGIVPLAPILVEAVSISGSTQQGSLLTATPGTWNGRPTPTLTYQWYRDGVLIVGETADTYTTVEDDAGTDVTVIETATNTGGAETQESNAISVVTAGSPEITVQPTAQQAEVGQTATFDVTATGSPSPTYQWQVNDGGGWVNVSTGTGGTTDSYTTATLVEGDDGNQYRVNVTNTGGTVTSDIVALTLVLQQDSIRFALDTGGATLVHDLGTVGHANFTIECLMLFEAREGNAQLFELGHTSNGRAVAIQQDNTFSVNDLSIGDTQTGYIGGGWATPPPEDTWIFVVLRSEDAIGGDFVATWTLAEGAPSTVYTATRANGIEGSVQGQRIRLNGGGSGSGLNGGVRFQYVRAYQGYRSDVQVAADRSSVDPTGAEFWWVFEDDGIGGITVSDATGNARTPTIVNGALATGPVVGGM